jgi:hypothetical protein
LPLRSLLWRSFAWRPAPVRGAVFLSLPILAGNHEFTVMEHVRSKKPAKISVRHEGSRSQRQFRLPQQGQTLSDDSQCSPSGRRQGRSSG